MRAALEDRLRKGAEPEAQLRPYAEPEAPAEAERAQDAAYDWDPPARISQWRS